MITQPPVLLTGANYFLSTALDFGGRNGETAWLFQVGTNLYTIGIDFSGTVPGFPLTVLKSADGGATWSLQDALNRPSTSNGGGLDAINVGGVFQILFGQTHSKLIIVTYDTGTDTFGAPGPALATLNGTFPMNCRLAMVSSGDLYAFWDEPNNTFVTSPIKYAVFSGGVWSAINTILSTLNRNFAVRAVIVDNTDLMHLIYQDGASSISNTIRLDHISLAIGGALSAVVNIDTVLTGLDWLVGRLSIWHGNLVVPTPRAGVAGVFTAPVASVPVFSAFTVVNTNPPIGVDNFMYSVLSASGTTVYVFWAISQFTAGVATVAQFWFATNTGGGGWNAPILLYDALTNPPPNPDLTSQNVHRPNVILESSGLFGVRVNLESNNNCVSFFLIDSGGPPPPPPVPPSPPTYWNPGSAVSLLCEKNYPWSVPPKDRIPVDVKNSIPAPVANVLTEIWNYTVPDGMWFVFDTLLFQANVAGFVPGSGSLIFTLDVNTPTTGAALPVGRPIAKFTTNVGDLAEPVQAAPVQLYQGDTLRAKVLITDNTLGVGLPNVIHAAVEGWLFPHSRNV